MIVAKVVAAFISVREVLSSCEPVLSVEPLNFVVELTAVCVLLVGITVGVLCKNSLLVGDAIYTVVSVGNNDTLMVFVGPSLWPTELVVVMLSYAVIALEPSTFGVVVASIADVLMATGAVLGLDMVAVALSPTELVVVALLGSNVMPVMWSCC